MTKETAEAIYEDWEEFARYGFNKSHAADYGVIAVETAYLKVHYTAEFMAALLSASASIAEKVALYVADARTMGVTVLPPEINASNWDFDIEDIDGKPSIRFGLGAIKNLGKSAMELVLAERQKNGPFKDLNDFARRLDLRALGKRGLECLIKVGALDAFGNRVALLAMQERIIAISSNHARAAEAGQLSLFGAATGVTETISLPDVNNVDKREMLNWERELIGLYISDHPLTPYQQAFTQIVTHFSGQLAEALNEDKVRVAGLITVVRPYVTKAGKPMGFATIEDIQGNIELVLFPRTWEKFREQLTVGRIIIVEGKADTSNTPPKILVENIRTEIKILEPLIAGPTPAATKPVIKQTPAPVAKPQQPTKPAAAQVKQAAERPATYTAPLVSAPAAAAGTGSFNMPPPPDNFPDGWEAEWQPSFEVAQIAARPELREDTLLEPKDEEKSTIIKKNPSVDDVDSHITYEGENEPEKPEVEALKPIESPGKALAVQPIEPTPVETHNLPSLYIPVAQEEKNKDHPPQQITVMLRSTGDKERDKLRIKTIYGTLISFHGHDRFSFQIFESGKGHLIDFPSDTTRLCPEMLARLGKLMGEESWRIEEITFQ